MTAPPTPARLDAIHPRTRVPLELEAYDPTGTPRRRRGGRLPARRRRAGGGRAPRAGRPRRGPLGRLPAARSRDLRGLVRRAQGAGAARCGRVRPAGADRAAIAGADLVANPGCYPTAALLGLAPLARAGLIGDVVIDAKSGVSGAGRGRRSPSTSSPPTRRHALQDRRAPPHAGDRAGARALGTTSRLVHAASGAARPGRAGHLLRHAARELDDDGWSSSTTTRTRASRSSSSHGPVGMLEVRDTNYCRVSCSADAPGG